MFQEFAPYLDFWVKGQKNGFAGNLERIKLSDGSKLVFLHEHPLLYVDQWYGADLGGGHAILYNVTEFEVTEDPSNPLRIVGTPVARLAYTGRITGRFSEQEMQDFRPTFGDIPQSEIIWKVLKSALGQVNRKRPFRGPEHYEYPEFPRLYYMDREWINPETASGQEFILLRKGTEVGGTAHYEGSYDFVFIKKNLEDKLPKLEPKSI